MPFFYYILVLLLYIMAVPLLLYLSFKKKYRYSIPARFFLKNNPPFENQDIWFHACSLGEVTSIEPIIDILKDDLDVDISVITNTGYERAKKLEKISFRYLPFEIFLPFWIRKHKTLVVVEAELWPMLFCIAKLKGMKTILLNARISDNSYSGYLRFSWFYRWVFSNIDIVFAQSEIDKDRLVTLGARDVRVSGNIKTAKSLKISKKYSKNSKKRVILIASTHEKEEQLILEHISIKEGDMLIVVPRHPERFAKVDRFLSSFSKNRGLKYSKLSNDSSLDYDVILCDLMGELINLYSISDIVILGGSFVEGVGGHNPMEPAFFENVIISGEHYFNQKPLFKLVENIKICKIDELDIFINGDKPLKKSKIKNRGDLTPIIEEIKRDNGKSL